MKKMTTRTLRHYKLKEQTRALQMLTCYDFQTAQLLNESALDLILVGDSVGNVILGHTTTVEVTLNEMEIFGSAVKRGAADKFVVVDMPFGSYSLIDDGVKNGLSLFQKTKSEALKLEGASANTLAIIQHLTQSGVPVMGHIGLTPQSVHQLGGYYMHGKNQASADALLDQAQALQQAGAFSIVLECVTPDIAAQITQQISIPTIGIGSGNQTDGQVLVINDLLKMGKDMPPSFCTPVADLFKLKQELINSYLQHDE